MPTQSSWRWYTRALLGMDAVLLGVAFGAAAAFRGAFGLMSGPIDFDERRYGLVAVALIPILLVVIWLRHGYSRQHLFGGPEEYARVVSGCTYGMLLVVAASYLYGSIPLVSRGWLLVFWILAVLLLCTGRFLLRRSAYALRRWGWFTRRALIAGSSDQGLEIAQQLHGPGGHGVHIVGFLDDYLAPGTIVSTLPFDPRRHRSDDFVIVGHPRDASALTSQYHCDLLIVVPTALSWESQQGLALLSDAPDSQLDVRLAPTLNDLTTASVEPAPLGYVPLVRPRAARIVGVEALVRSAIDDVVAALWLMLSAPLVVWVLLAARLRGFRPILVRRKVLGERNRPVALILLDRQVCGSLLLRGVPAMFAVLRGDLALVGPRPVPVEEQAAYAPWLGLLTTVKPGLTGPWRMASRSLSGEEMLMADVWWVRNWTIWQHLFVLLQTGLHALSGSATHHTLARWEVDQLKPEHADGVMQHRAA